MEATDDARTARKPIHLVQPIEAAQIPDALLTVKTVALLVGVQPRTIWLWAKADRFPKPKRYGRRMTRWRAATVTEWLARRTRGEL